MNKTQISFLILIVVIFALGVTFVLSVVAKPEPLPAYQAAINRDCAPWDGAAFTVNVPMSDGRSVSILIWQAPEISERVSFSFPDNTGQVGNASLFAADGMPEQLSGTVVFERVQTENPVNGQFDLVTSSGEHFKGRLTAAWGDQVMLCG